MMLSSPTRTVASPASVLLFVAVSLALPWLVISQNTRTAESTTKRSRTSTSSGVDDGMEIYDILNVQRPDDCPFPRWRRWSWKWHSRLLPLLHFGQGDTCPPDSFVNLRVLWNKALTSLDRKSPANEALDHYPTFHMLPRVSRWLLFRAIPLWMYPRWMHANIELRTVYLNRAVEDEVKHFLRAGKVKQFELVVLGGGYDIRSIRTLSRYPEVTKAWELDLEPVIESKRKLVQRLFQQLPQLSSTSDSLRFRAVDLNDLDHVGRVLTEIAQERPPDYHTIILTEAILMYLENDKPAKIIEMCRKQFGPNISWLLVDRLKDIPDSGKESSALSRKFATEYFTTLGWQVVDWMMKPGATRHMGIVRPST